jgi:type II secretory ATPase GspE/PulE/Tfp pilus assembly ATPase PilB-like protein
MSNSLSDFSKDPVKFIKDKFNISSNEKNKDDLVNHKENPKAQVNCNNKSVVSVRKNKKVSKSRVNNNVVRKSEELPKYHGIISGVNEIIHISESLLDNYCVLLLSKDNEKVIILCSEGSRTKAVDNRYLEIASQCKDLGYKFKRIFTTQNIIKILNNKKSGKVDLDLKENKKGPYHDIFDNILLDAINKGSSDIHIEVGKDIAKLKMRVNGQMSEVDEYPTPYAFKLSSVIYTSIAEETDVTFNSGKPQDAVIDRVIHGKRMRLRLATIPSAPDGFDLILRLLPIEDTSLGKTRSLSDLGYSNMHIDFLKIGMAIPVGVIIIAGVTGSGKSTTSNVMLTNKIKESKGKIKVITIEDPPEYLLSGATQVPVIRSKAEDGQNPFAVSMRASLRSDPDILMPGEIRDKDSAELLVNAVQSGHQVYTTLHSASAIGSVSRLRGMNVSSSVLGSQDFISTLIYQALLPITCKSCCHSFEEFQSKNNITASDSELIDRIKTVTKSNFNEIVFTNELGCEKCNYTGIKGREVIAEVVVPDFKMKKMFQDGDDAGALEYFKSSGGKLIIDHAIDKMIEGKADPRDVEKKVGRIDMGGFNLKDLIKSLEAERKKTHKVKSSLSLANKKSANIINIEK